MNCAWTDNDEKDNELAAISQNEIRIMQCGSSQIRIEQEMNPFEAAWDLL
jgi:hypothetical protein